VRTRCPECDGLLKAGAEWCPQCYADLREPEPEPGPETPAGAEPRTPDGRARHRAPDDGAVTPGWPCPDCGTVNDLAAGACAGCGQGFLAPLSGDRGLPVLTGLTSMSRAARIGAAVGAIVVLLGLLAGLLWLVS
jgi:hypothetical protein